MKLIRTLEGSFISIQAPSISIPVSGLKKFVNSDVQYLGKHGENQTKKAESIVDRLLFDLGIKPVCRSK